MFFVFVLFFNETNKQNITKQNKKKQKTKNKTKQNKTKNLQRTIIRIVRNNTFLTFQRKQNVPLDLIWPSKKVTWHDTILVNDTWYQSKFQVDTINLLLERILQICLDMLKISTNVNINRRNFSSSSCTPWLPPKTNKQTKNPIICLSTTDRP